MSNLRNMAQTVLDNCPENNILADRMPGQQLTNRLTEARQLAKAVLDTVPAEDESDGKEEAEDDSGAEAEGDSDGEPAPKKSRKRS